jgi:hypothetical protein
MNAEVMEEHKAPEKINFPKTSYSLPSMSNFIST